MLTDLQRLRRRRRPPRCEPADPSDGFAASPYIEKRIQFCARQSKVLMPCTRCVVSRAQLSNYYFLATSSSLHSYFIFDPAYSFDRSGRDSSLCRCRICARQPFVGEQSPHFRIALLQISLPLPLERHAPSWLPTSFAHAILIGCPTLPFHQRKKKCLHRRLS